MIMRRSGAIGVGVMSCNLWVSRETFYLAKVDVAGSSPVSRSGIAQLFSIALGPVPPGGAAGGALTSRTTAATAAARSSGATPA